MIDIHCHILPYTDDGPCHLIKCKEMAQAAISTGITHIFATPHHHNGLFENPKADILNRVIEFNKYLHQANIPLTVHPGQELRIHREIFISLEMGEVLTLDNKDKYLLLELPSGEVPTYTQEIVYELLLKEITPIIVHPERHRGFIEENNLLFELVQEGALTQLTSGSILGHFGKKVKSLADKMIEHNLAHFIATDAHNTNSRGFSLQEAYETITNKFGINRTFYFKENAELLLCGQYIYKEEPVPIRKRILGIL
ncbi:Tyrosine-protein phosphatase YwqE [Neobacillus rhizosphaerae]|uniref:Tyrosine-protein phosphatase n=1 Tax=Neobacillus rhizosphaerae TaxID=2880965 RepID=A0ABN8KR42_9BACI|nr:CpsB/CapC family capsule biosynthesis tyrosine phosphatase [Neobacillus rhizosphaerae]CAH2714878.1 Tyrosine-protein phosphatase YwqE [Neobacillus rhizosphaerae]